MISHRAVDAGRPPGDRTWTRAGGRSRLADAQVAAMKSAMTWASCSPLSSCRKCPAPLMVVWGCPAVPGTRPMNMPSPPLVIGSPSLNAHGNVLAKLGLRDRVQAVILAYETGLVVPGDLSG